MHSWAFERQMKRLIVHIYITQISKAKKRERWQIGLRKNSNAIGVTYGAGTPYPSGASGFTPCFWHGFRVARSLVFCVVFLYIIVCQFVFFSFDHCIVFPSSIYFRLPVRYPQPFFQLTLTLAYTLIERNFRNVIIWLITYFIEITPNLHV